MIVDKVISLPRKSAGRLLRRCSSNELDVIEEALRLFLPFRCNKERQMAAKGGTKRNPKIVRFSLRQLTRVRIEQLANPVEGREWGQF